MTIIEAENQYKQEVANYIEQHQKKYQKAKFISIIIGSMLILIGIVLRCTTPSEIDSLGYEDYSAALFQEGCGIVLLVLGVVSISIISLLLHKFQKDGPDNFLPQIKNLYFNYLKCEDMSKDGKDFYKEKLKDIRNMELVSAVHGAASSASSAIIFSTLMK